MTVVYSSDRKFYKYLPTAINSLLIHNPDVNIYIFAEDDSIECIQRTDNITIINIHNYPTFIDYTHPNWKKYWGFFPCIKCFLTKILKEDKVLWLDVDTLVLDNIEELWNINIDDYAIAGWREQPEEWEHVKNDIHASEYVNVGVLLMNLKFIKENGLDDACIDYLNTHILKYPEQDALNIICDGHIEYFGAEYNFGPIVPWKEKDQIDHIKIYHMTRTKLWNNPAIMPGLWEKYYQKILK